MAKTRRLSSEERRDSILKAARRVFAENGFRGTTTKALAEAAGVSEALLFQHFPTKEALYTAMLSALFGEHEPDVNSQLVAMEPSTATLVLIVHQFYKSLIDPRGRADKADVANIARLMFRSVVEDGEFARLFIQRIPSRMVAKLEECIKAAVVAHDLNVSHSHFSIQGWFTHHLAIILMLHQLADPPIVDYGVSKATLIEEAVLFALRGIGLKEKAIRRYLVPKKSSATQY
ncbi:MAG TPA: helix-turn-helix domain-containing protein [Isosphaeraceae bacterium]|nr:helix-turn-helix domain-containing protein [Isosphaeraceae bacterium]